MKKRKIVIYFNVEGRMNIPGVETYCVSSEHEIDMALLNDLITPLSLVIVGGEDAKQMAKAYHGVWVEPSGDIQSALDS